MATPFRVALTGNIASGKSAVADVWRGLGAAVVDADALARHVVAPGTPGLEAVRRRFGDDVVRPDGTLDRAALRRLVFADAAGRADLEALLHPEIARLAAEQEARLVREGADVVVQVIPLLFEAGLAAGFDLVVFVDAPEATRLARLVEHRDLDPVDARQMIAAQDPPEQKRKKSDILIVNDGTRSALAARAAEVWWEIRARAAACA